MALAISPNIARRTRIDAASKAGLSPCWTCSTCDQECPINRATGRLRPQKLIRMATLGLTDAMLPLADLWYCLTCRRCTNVCPNQVKPESLIGHLRTEAVRRGLVSIDTYRNYNLFFMRFQQIRLRMATDLLRGETTALGAKDWHSWLDKPLPANGDGDVVFIQNAPASSVWRADIDSYQVSACFTCSECSNACPIAGDRKVFDPQRIFRMANMGLIEPLLTSPAIWLCLQCGRCSDTCGQLVQGCQIIEFLQQKAITDGYVPADFPFRWAHAQSWIYSEFVGQVDALLSAPH